MSATLIKVKGVWHYRFQVAGQRVQRSTRETSKTRADQVARREHDAAVAKANGGEPVPTLHELITMWLEFHRPISSVHHIRSVETFAKLHLYDLGDKRIDNITTTNVERARIEHLQERKPATANHWLRILKLLMKWAVKRKIIPKLPWEVAMIKVQKRPRAMLPVDVAKRWFEEVDKAAVRSPGTGTAVRLMFGLGVREGESTSARWEWLDWERGTYTPGRTKGKEAVPITLPTWLREHLQPSRQAEGLIACRPDGQPFAPGFARNAMRKANAACQVIGITPHRLRGTFATLLSENGVPVQTIQRVMRHKHVATTLGYLEVNLSIATTAQNRIGEKIGFGGAKVANDSA